ncbi:MAG: hypothetical protein ABW321_07395 [Polyangiales bacterium]
MLGKILGSGQLGKLASFVSPAFFDVMPARALWSRSRELVAQSRNGELAKRAITARAATLAASMPQIQLSARSEPGNATAAGTLSAADRGALIAELYFRQLFDDGPVLLDLRAAAFTAKGDQLLWAPASWIAQWKPDFIQPLREIYAGFYAHDDARFRRGLAALSLEHSEDLFREQFGGTQDRVKFEVQAFIDTFHRVFERCKRERTSLHPDFLPLGIYLAALYDHEQELGVAIDVTSAFIRATGSGEQTTSNAHADTSHKKPSTNGSSADA